ncbi:hypothetical protein MNVI_33840 [Mycobacterium noviomagense]|uniref:Uncharacterized protein n=1 Tax=Mycobacterium noviomagense TaxID=459858 RepID=A0A7I7PHL5_9MYCO|nr:hypothetical protein MNVI_33840 [Mycobacterium noviomagense]
MQRPIASVADQVGDPRIELFDDLAEVLDGGGFMHFAPPADDATQLGTATSRRTILSCQRIDDDA